MAFYTIVGLFVGICQKGRRQIPTKRQTNTDKNVVGICLLFCRYLSAFLSVFVAFCRFLSVISTTPKYQPYMYGQ
jgi:energy-converting hydrogenase Eha subunit E